MSILEPLRNNKGTLSTELAKTLAKEALDGNPGILEEAVDLACYYLDDKKEKNVRSGAAKLIECVAAANPGLVSPYLDRLLPALEADEPQTRWAIMRTFGFCAKEEPGIAKKAIPFARRYIREKVEGQLCLVSSADLFLGDYGETSKEAAQEAYPILLESCDNAVPNEHDWIVEAFMKIARYLEEDQKRAILGFADEYADFPRKKTQERVQRLRDLCR